MVQTVFKEINYSMGKLVEDIDMGVIGLPDIQRPFVWERARVRDLFDSMYQGFPVGYLLFWANIADAARTIGPDGKQKAPSLLIVDGQQRLTSLYAVRKNQPILDKEYRTSRIQISFRPSDGTFEVADATSHRDPELVADVSTIWQVPSWRAFINDFLKRLAEGRHSRGGALTDADADKIQDALDRLRGLDSYPFTVLELASTVNEEQVADVFVRINSKGVSLKQADFILTLMSVWWDNGRKELETFCRQARQSTPGRPSPYNHFIHPSPDQLLRVSVAVGFRRAVLKAVYSLLRGKDPDTEEFRDDVRQRNFERLKEAQAKVVDLTNWHEFLKAVLQAGYRSGAMISSANVLLFTYALFLMGRHDFQVPLAELRRVIARWFFMASLTGRYSGSFETTAEEDFARLRSLDEGDAQGFVETLDRVIDYTLTDDFWSITLPNELETSGARTPALFAYYASLILLDAKVLFSDLRVAQLFDPQIRGNRSSLERHHLFPRAYLKSIGYETTRDINQIANYALVEWPDNATISDEPPSSYFPPLTGRMIDWDRYVHALPQGWENMDYDAFLPARRKLMAAVIRDGFGQLTETSRSSERAAS